MRSIVAAFVLALLASSALAQPAKPESPSSWHEKTAKELAADCHAQDAAKHAECVGYVSAIYDLQFTSNPPGLCLPANLTPESLTEVVVAYIDTHDDGPAPAAIGQSIVRFFPCTSGATPAVRR
jgi:sulfur relay (sulfurtransferase) DsrC/TusE family protein